MKDVKDASAGRPGALPEDERLRLALRHAPDAELGAPAHLSAQIVAAGYRAAAQPAPRPQPAAAGGTLRGPWRLGASGAFASVALAGVIGLMWRGEPPPAVSPRGEPALAAPTNSTPASASSDKRIELMEQAPQSQTRAKQSAGRDTDASTWREGMTPAKIVPSAEKAAAQSAEREVSPTPTTAAATAAPAPEQRVAAAPAVGDTAAPPDRAAAPVAPQPATPNSAMAPPPPVATPALNDRAHAAVRALPARASASVGPAAATAAAATGAEAASPHRPRAFAPAAAPAPLALATAPARNMRVTPRVEAPWMAALAEGTAVQWWVQGQMREAPSSWLMAVAAQASGRWQAATSSPGSDETTVEWRRGGVLLGRLWLNDERALWCDPAAVCEQALMASEAGATLRHNLPR